MNRQAIAAAGVLLSFAVSDVVGAAEAPYPNRSVRFIVGFVPGGPSDILARLVAAKLHESLGHPFIVDNRGSVGGVLGFEAAAKANPDGYTILLAPNSAFTINPHVYAKLPYDTERDFQPVSQLTSVGNVMVVHPSLQATTLPELIALARAKPGQLNHATTGTGNLLGIAHFKVMAGIDMVAIPYKGTGQAVVALVAGEVQFFLMNPLVAVPHVKAGRLRGLAVSSMTRNPMLPDLPTADEAGMRGFKNYTWHSIVVPAKTPKAIVNKLNAELVKIVHMPDVKERFMAQGVTGVGSTPAAMWALMREESAEVAKVVKQIGLKAQ